MSQITEMIYKIDNWTIVKVVGGFGVVFIGILAFASRLLTDKVNHIWTKKANTEIETIKSQLTQYNSTLTNIQTNYLNHIQGINSKKTESIDVLWQSVLDLKREIPSFISLVLSILTDTEYKNISNSKYANISNEIRKLDSAIDIQFIVKHIEKIDNRRPYLNEELYSLFKTYSVLIGRICFITIENCNKNKSDFWKEDDSILSIIKNVLRPDELDIIITTEVGGFNTLTSILELKILDGIKSYITGQEINTDVIKQMKKLEIIMAAEQKSAPNTRLWDIGG